jgi:putative solute:sodium symporter small subunit
MDTPDPRGYWRANLRLVSALLVIWAVVSFGLSIVFVEPLNETQLGGFPLGFWFAHQGSIYVFIVLLIVYAFASDRMARKYGVD